MTKSAIVTGGALDVLSRISDNYIDCCVTSPPYYGLRDYGAEGQLGLEETLDEYISNIVEVFREVRRTLRPDGTLWLNLGDTYSRKKCSGVTPKTLWEYRGELHLRCRRTAGIRDRILCGTSQTQCRRA